MRGAFIAAAVAAAAGLLFAQQFPVLDALAAQRGAPAQQHAAAPRPPANDAASLDLKSQQLAEKEAALKAKEEALRKLEATLQARVNQLNAAQKGLEGSIAAKKKLDDERFQKMVKIYKGLKPEDAAALLNKLDSRMTIAVLDKMDQKTVIKLIPLITQPRVLQWSRLNLSGR
jgi:flagellar protein FlbB